MYCIYIPLMYWLQTSMYIIHIYSFIDLFTDIYMHNWMQETRCMATLGQANAVSKPKMRNEMGWSFIHTYCIIVMIQSTFGLWFLYGMICKYRFHKVKSYPEKRGWLSEGIRSYMYIGIIDSMGRTVVNCTSTCTICTNTLNLLVHRWLINYT